MEFGESVVETDGVANIGSFIVVGPGKETALETGKDEIAKLAVGKV